MVQGQRPGPISGLPQAEHVPAPSRGAPLRRLGSRSLPNIANAAMTTRKTVIALISMSQPVPRPKRALFDQIKGGAQRLDTDPAEPGTTRPVGHKAQFVAVK